ncbi:hypothetical protein Tco_0770528 [Tanacetum coccineum]|uniref:Uncharacterized protein n=1 Tax=Tanacetum coccineum TaxID=301880 RepID=A0ABQ4ZFF0_9ASTR
MLLEAGCPIQDHIRMVYMSGHPDPSARTKERVASSEKQEITIPNGVRINASTEIGTNAKHSSILEIKGLPEVGGVRFGGYGHQQVNTTSSTALKSAGAGAEAEVGSSCLRHMLRTISFSICPKVSHAAEFTDLLIKVQQHYRMYQVDAILRIHENGTMHMLNRSSWDIGDPHCGGDLVEGTDISMNKDCVLVPLGGCLEQLSHSSSVCPWLYGRIFLKWVFYTKRFDNRIGGSSGGGGACSRGLRSMCACTKWK